MLTRESPTLTPDQSAFASDVAEYLQRRPRQLPSRYFYDALGSALFDAICRLPWYRITRAESALLARHSHRFTEGLAQPLHIAELGCGNGEKLVTLVRASHEGFQRIHLIDISAAALAQAQASLAAAHSGAVTAFRGTYEQGLAGLRRRHGPGTWLVLFLGSNIGNFDPPAARDLLRQIHGALEPGDALLLGADLVKPARELALAYDDPLHVTAAFNLNLLQRINTELGGTFDLEGFRHRAIWNRDERRVEMHLVSTRRQTVRIAAADLEIEFEPDESIWTESSYKWASDSIVAEGRAAGFGEADQWIDHDAGFALTRFLV